jgi:hypothetical protein
VRGYRSRPGHHLGCANRRPRVPNVVIAVTVRSRSTPCPSRAGWPDHEPDRFRPNPVLLAAPRNVLRWTENHRDLLNPRAPVPSGPVSGGLPLRGYLRLEITVRDLRLLRHGPDSATRLGPAAGPAPPATPRPTSPARSPASGADRSAPSGSTWLPHGPEESLAAVDSSQSGS